MFENLIKNIFLKRLEKIAYGELFLTLPEGRSLHIKGRYPGPSADLYLKDWRVVVNLLIKGDIGLAEDYRDGYFGTKSLLNLLLFGLRNEQHLQAYTKGSYFYNIIARIGYLTQRNTLKQSKKNIHAHYDLGNNFYQLWLDESMTYSSGIYLSKEDSLQQAQKNKYQKILDSLTFTKGSILEIGCGWGGFIDMAMQHGDYLVKGITLSSEQQEYAIERLMPYKEKVSIALEDYRVQHGNYDMIVSIEMIEAVGKKYWPIYFKKLKSLLNNNGKIVLQSIVIDDALFDRYVKGSDVIRTYIFPGGMLPSVKILEKQLRKSGLRLLRKHHFGLDYAETLSQWLERFSQHESQLLSLGFDKRFQRMWKFYLCSCIAAFKCKKIDVVQLEIVHEK